MGFNTTGDNPSVRDIYSEYGLAVAVGALAGAAFILLINSVGSNDGGE